MRTIRHNLFWAFAYNVILVPTAILSPLIPFLKEQAPIFAAAAMALSSVTVVSNSLRLRRFRARGENRRNEQAQTSPGGPDLSKTLPVAHGKHSSPRGKTLWDWMQVLAIPLTLLVIVVVLMVRPHEIHEQGARESQIAANRQAESTLVSTEKELSDLLLTAKLAQSRPGDGVRLVAHAYVFNALSQIDAERKRALINFLFTTNLISGHRPIVNLSEADLRYANLSSLDLSQINLSNANLSNATFVGANFAHANLGGANLVQADLTRANLEGADFRGASLRAAVLDHADLLNATHVQSALHDARTLSGATLPDGTISS